MKACEIFIRNKRFSRLELKQNFRIRIKSRKSIGDALSAIISRLQNFLRSMFLSSAHHRVFFFLSFFFFLLALRPARNRCGHISGACNHQFRARKRQVKRVRLRALLKQTFCSTKLTWGGEAARIRAFPLFVLCARVWKTPMSFSFRSSCSRCSLLTRDRKLKPR